jgi:WD40 repeat protein
MAIAFSPDGNTIASGSADSTVKLWSSSTAVEQCTLKDHTQAIAALAFSSDNKTLASGSWDGTVKLWSTRTHKLKRTLDCSSGRVNSVAFSPDGKVLAVGSDTLTLWSPRTGKTLATFTGHTSPISAVVFGILPRASLEKPQLALISASWDNTIQIWRSQ